MNGYLVVLKSECADMPLKLCQTREEAEEFVRAVTQEVVEPIARSLGRSSAPNLGTNANAFITLVEFRQGLPCSQDFVREFDEESFGAS